MFHRDMCRVDIAKIKFICFGSSNFNSIDVVKNLIFTTKRRTFFYNYTNENEIKKLILKMVNNSSTTTLIYMSKTILKDSMKFIARYFNIFKPTNISYFYN